MKRLSSITCAKADSSFFSTKELQHYKEIENTLKSAIMKAEETGDNIKKMAREEREMIITDAKHNASRIVNEALLKAEKIEVHADTVERNMRIFMN